MFEAMLPFTLAATASPESGGVNAANDITPGGAQRSTHAPM
ncbi:hypothetical protein HMPREF9413_1887 [Paenibacillus sp. HGF7]|nr:hypothetical protein HMPREF9413_1887 [Paenibacillus sp. HGF7]